MIMSARLALASLVLTTLLAAGCASVHYSPGDLASTDRKLVFGRILLIRDGEEGVLRPMSTQVSLTPVESTAEARMLLESFDRDGRFRWLLAPGNHVLTMGLNPNTGEVVSCAFSVPESAMASYFGELRLVGRKRFNTIGGANVKDVRVEVRDMFEEDAPELLRLDPSLNATDVVRGIVVDISDPGSRQKYFRALLDAAPLSGPTLSSMRFEPLAAGSASSRDIEAGPGAFAFDEGKSFFAAFALPDSARFVTITSHPFGSGVIDRFRIFVPAALLLDQDFSVIETVESCTFPVPATLLPPAPAKLSGTIDLDALPRRPRYLVLYTTDQLLGSARHSSRPAVLAIPGGAIPTGLGTPVDFEAWITGKITVKALPR